MLRDVTLQIYHARKIQPAYALAIDLLIHLQLPRN